MGQYMGCDHVEVMLNNHECYYSKEDILDQIKENEKIIEQLKTKLFGMACGRPSELFSNKDCEGNDVDPVDNAIDTFNSIFDNEDFGLTYLIIHNVYLQQIYDHWDKRWSEFDGYGLEKEEDSTDES